MVTYLMAAVLTVCLFAAAWWLGLAVLLGAVLIFARNDSKVVS